MSAATAVPPQRTAPAQNRFLLNAALSFAYVTVVALGLKRFTVWDQIRDIANADPLDLFDRVHAHTFRLALMLPSLPPTRPRS